jgi:hypothetical protein
MTITLRHQLTQLDRTIVELLNERARLCRDLEPLEVQREACIDDLLRRSGGPFPAEELREAFAAIDRGCGVEAR